MNWNQRREREHMLEEAEAIAQKAKDEHRQLTDAEIAESDKLIDDAEAIAGGAPDSGDRQTTSNEICDGVGNVIAGRSGEGGWRTTTVEMWRASDGTSMPVLSKGQRLSDLAPSKAYRDIPSGEQFDIGRYLVAAATGKWANIPEERFEKLAQSSIIQSAGGAAVPEPIARSFIDNARAQSVMFKAGMKIVPMASGTLDLARVTADPISSTTSNVTAENATIASTDIVFDRVQLTAVKIGQIVKASRELVNDAPNMASLISSVLTKSFAAELDRLILDGTAAEGITGLSNLTSLSETDVSGAISWEDLMTAWESVALANFEPNGVIMGPATLEDLQVLLGNSEVNMFVGGPPIAEALPKFVSTSCNTTDAFVGDFSKVLLGLRQDVEVSVTTEAGSSFADNQMWFRLIWRGDMQVEDPGAIHRLFGITH